jgi:ribosome-binding factor A
MSENPRAKRLADRIKVIVAQLLETRIKDPRLGFVTITDVRVTGDLQMASIFYTVYGSDDDRAGTAAALESAKGLIRSEVGKQTGVRLTPSVEFHLDAVPETAAHIAEALAEARRRDEELARLRQGAHYAGEEDPYKKPHEDSGLDDDFDGDAEVEWDDAAAEGGDLTDAGFDLTDADENLAATDEYAGLTDFDTLEDPENAHERDQA